MKNNIYILAYFLSIGLNGCWQEKNTHEHHAKHEITTHANHDSMHHGDHDGQIMLTEQQINSMQIKTGTFSHIKINDFIKANGILSLPPNAYYSLIAKNTGFLSQCIKLVEGDYIKKGTVIAYLENPQFIEKQQQYWEIRAEQTYHLKELSRQKELLAADAGVAQKVEQISSIVAVNQAKLNGLSKQLAYIGIDVNTVSNAEFTGKIPITAPMSGYITSVNIHDGLYASPDKILVEIINDAHLHLELNVFEKDISKIKKGLPISYKAPAIGETIYEGKVHVIAKTFDKESKAVRVHGHLDGKKPPFFMDLFVESKIWLNNETVAALPTKSIIQDGDFSYIYILNQLEDKTHMLFKAIRVVPKQTMDGFTSIDLIDPIPENAKIVTNGAYFVYAQSKSGELEHDH